MNRDAGPTILPRRSRAGLALLALGAALIAALGFGPVSYTLGERKDRIENMNAEEKEQLWRKYERFRVLPPAEQDRLRQLDAALEADAQAAQLRQVIQRYQRWLERLSPAERAELISLDPRQRLARISQLRAEEARRLGPQDAEAFAAWFEAVLIRQRPGLKRMLEQSASEFERRAHIRRALETGFLRAPGRPPPPNAPEASKRPFWNPDDLAKLKDSLSETARRQLDEAAQPVERRKLVLSWLRQAYFKNAAGQGLRLSPTLSEERLRKFFDEELDVSERVRLLGLPLDQMQRQLRQLYHQRHPQSGGGAMRQGERTPKNPL
jgi:hypothetical protein